MKTYKRMSAIVVLMSSAILLTGSGATALPLTAGAKDIALGVQDQTLTTQVQARRSARGAPRMGGTPRAFGGPAFRAPRVGGRPIVRAPRFAPRHYARRRAPVIIGISPFFYDPFPYYYDPYYYEPYYYYGAPYDWDAVAYCKRRFKSYDVRTRTYLGYDGLRHPCP